MQGLFFSMRAELIDGPLTYLGEGSLEILNHQTGDPHQPQHTFSNHVHATICQGHTGVGLLGVGKVKQPLVHNGVRNCLQNLGHFQYQSEEC